MNKKDLIVRLQNIVKTWDMSIASYPPEIAAAQTSMVVMRAPDIEAIKLALETLQKESVHDEQETS